jgi:DNA invertase Pin-like site-specific DNA recombinase
MTEDVCLFRRTSTGRQSTDNQDTAEARAHIERHGYNVAKTIDLPDVSGSKEHPDHLAALEEILADISAGLYKKVLIRDASRLDRRSRNHAELFRLRVWEAGGKVEAVRNEHYGADNLLGDIMTSKEQREAHDYSVKLSRDIRDANAANDKRGMWRGRAPWGWIVRCVTCGTVCRGEVRCLHRGSKILVPGPDAPVIAELFERIRRGDSVPQAQAWLASIGRDKNAGSITATIRRDWYRTGIVSWTDHEGVVREHRTTPLADPDLWRGANASLDSRPSTAPKGSRRPREDFSGVVRCGDCGAVAYRNFASGKVNPDKSRQRRRIYWCRTCQRSWDADSADCQVQELLSGDTSPEWHMVTIAPQQQRTERLEAVEEALRDLPRRNLPEADEDAERARLRAERRVLRDLPEDEPARREPLSTGRTWGQAWDAMSGHRERLEWLRSQPFELRLAGRGMGVVVNREWLTEQVDLARGADLGDGMAAVIASVGPVYWSKST